MNSFIHRQDHLVDRFSCTGRKWAGKTPVAKVSRESTQLSTIQRGIMFVAKWMKVSSVISSVKNSTGEGCICIQMRND